MHIMDTLSRFHFPYINSILKVFPSMVMVLVPMIASGAPLPVPGPAPAEVKILSNYTDICNICNDFVPIKIYNVTLHLYYLSVSVIS